MKKLMTVTSVLIIFSALMSACNLKPTTPTPLGPDQISTIAKATVDALTTQMAPPPATATPLPTEAPTATATLLVPTLDLTVPTLSLSTSTPIPLPTSLSVAGCNQISKIEDITIPDNSLVKAKTTFVKTWRIYNGGTCTWNSAYNANFVSGDTLAGDVSINLKEVVPPGGSTLVSVNLTAPAEDGTYKQYWNLTDAENKPFGFSGGGLYYVVFKVGTTATTTSGYVISTSASDTNGSRGTVITVDGNIDISGIGTTKVVVKYLFRIDGTKCSPATTIAFTADGSQAVSAQCTIANSLSDGNHTLELYISEPHGANNVSYGTLAIP